MIMFTMYDINNMVKDEEVINQGINVTSLQLRTKKEQNISYKWKNRFLVSV